jgi:hypothetical protein
MQAFIPGESPPEVNTAIFFMEMEFRFSKIGINEVKRESMAKNAN